jgi:WhiB family redox-sensing transcriptional regulator
MAEAEPNYAPEVAQRQMLPIEPDSEKPGWADFSNCLGVDPDIFSPERGASTREAKEVCSGCVVRDECLEYALITGQKFGVWGGLTERERRRIRRQRTWSAENFNPGY